MCCATLSQVSALVESRYNAVERLLAYAALEPEQQPAAAAVRPPLPYGCTGTWPTAGALEFRHVVMRYRPGLDPVLKGVSFKVRNFHADIVCGHCSVFCTVLEAVVALRPYQTNWVCMLVPMRRSPTARRSVSWAALARARAPSSWRCSGGLVGE